MSLLGPQRIVERAKKDVGTFSQVSVGIAPTLLAVRNDQRSDLAIINASAMMLFIDISNTVTIADGAPIPPNSGAAFDSFTGVLYGVVAAGAAVVGVIEI